ncbi:DUF2232 domain-containing protein [Rhizobium sp. RCC_161_2]|uniref:DUF2232 domain-containing protein n=1 Tax=Rhizobium sp. RCC_161_2 TaxID=3239219 RepID=UPI0035269929
MKNLNAKVLGIGALAGFTAILLARGAVAQPSFSAVLYTASALPILIAGLGWGNIAAVVAVVSAAALGALAIDPSFALAVTLVTLAPAGWLSHLANLARPASELGGPDHLMAWYPLSDILLHLCGLVTLAVVVIGIMIGYGPELVGKIVDELITALTTQNPTIVFDPQTIAPTKATLLLMLPVAQASAWVILLFAAYYIATRIVAASGRNLRPREDIPSALRMNRNAIFVFLASIVACFVGGIPAMVGATVFGAFGAGFLISGYAALHFRTRGKSWRAPVLILCYLVGPIIALFILILGLSDTRKAIALTPNKNAEIPKQPDTKI